MLSWRKLRRGVLILFALLTILMQLTFSTGAHEKKKKSTLKEVYTGTIVSMNGGLLSTSFNLIIAACRIDLKRDKKTEKFQLELENFGTYPHKVMGVMRRN